MSVLYPIAVCILILTRIVSYRWSVSELQRNLRSKVELTCLSSWGYSRSIETEYSQSNEKKTRGNIFLFLCNFLFRITSMFRCIRQLNTIFARIFATSTLWRIASVAMISLCLGNCGTVVAPPF